MKGRGGRGLGLTDSTGHLKGAVLLVASYPTPFEGLFGPGSSYSGLDRPPVGPGSAYSGLDRDEGAHRLSTRERSTRGPHDLETTLNPADWVSSVCS